MTDQEQDDAAAARILAAIASVPKYDRLWHGIVRSWLDEGVSPEQIESDLMVEVRDSADKFSDPAATAAWTAWYQGRLPVWLATPLIEEDGPVNVAECIAECVAAVTLATIEGNHELERTSHEAVRLALAAGMSHAEIRAHTIDRAEAHAADMTQSAARAAAVDWHRRAFTRWMTTPLPIEN
jgi:hypothetical protein